VIRTFSERKRIMSYQSQITSLLMAVVFAGSTVAMGQPGFATGQSPEGAWSVAINYNGLPPCRSAPAVFTREGTIIADSCSASIGVGYGSWVRTGNREFASTFIGNNYGPGGAVIGSYKVRAKGEIERNGQTASGEFRTEVFDLAGNVVFVATGTVILKRIPVERL
jgi:hypothetical protein